MNFAEDIEFIAWTHRPECQAWVAKTFDYYVLDYAESGGLVMRIGEEPVRRLRGPVVFLTFPGPFIRFGRRRGHWNHRFISFRGPRADRFARTGLFPIATPVLPLREPQRFSAAFDELLHYMNHPRYGPARAALLLEGLLLQLHEQPATGTGAPGDPRLAAALETLRNRPEQPWDLRRLASRCGLSYPHFRRLFAAAAGTSPGQYLLAARMEKAGRLLRDNPPPSLQETAARCGYEDIYYFGKTFRKFHGIPPGRYRDNFQLK